MAKKRATAIICPHCFSSNPPKAYCCIHCFKIIRQQSKKTFWRRAVPPGIVAVVISVAGFSASYVVLKRWLQALEAQMTINVRMSEYYVSFAANKQMRKSLEIKADIQNLGTNATPEPGDAPPKSP